MIFHCFISQLFVYHICWSCDWWACQLKDLDKRPGIQHISIGETVRCFIAKAVLLGISDDIQCAAGCLQLCTGQPSRGEAAVHAMREIFNDDEKECYWLTLLMLSLTHWTELLHCIISISIFFYHSNKYLLPPAFIRFPNQRLKHKIALWDDHLE